MFRVTALGHQGWLVATEGTRVLIDPLLLPRVGGLAACGARVHPARRLDLDAMPPVDAALVTHEHPDHFDPASLDRLDRDIAIYLSAHASVACRRALAELGFRVHLLTPGAGVAIGDLWVMPISPYLIGEPGGNEVDVLPLLLWDWDGDGSFFTSVDVHASEVMMADVRAHIDRPGVWARANNDLDASLHYEWLAPDAGTLEATAQRLARAHAEHFEGWEAPAVTLVNGNGVRFAGDLAWANAHLFPVDPTSLATRLCAHLPLHRFEAALPGVTVVLARGGLAVVEREQPWLRIDETTSGAAHAQDAGDTDRAATQAVHFEPATGRRALAREDWDALRAHLADLARFLFLRNTFRGLYLLVAGRDHPPALRPTFALALRCDDDGARRVWEYDAAACAFVEVACDDPRAHYVAGAELWASDLLAVLRFDLSCNEVLHFGRKRLWNAAAARFRFDVDTELLLFTHPLRRPDLYHALHRRALDAGRADACVGRVRAARAADRPQRAWPSPNRGVPAPPGRPSAAAAGSDGARPLAPVLVEHIAREVERATGGAWRLVEATLLRDAVRARFHTGRVALALEAWHATGGPPRPRYRAAGGIAWAYNCPTPLEPVELRRLEALIDALGDVPARALGAPPR
jgi:hypothetical protein